MNDDDTPVMIMYPPELTDASVQAVWDFLFELSDSFERHYAVQLRRLLSTQARRGPPGDNEANEEPF